MGSLSRVSSERVVGVCTEAFLERAEAPMPAPMKVLVVDDSRTVRLIIADALGSEGFTVLEASNGTAGIEQLEQSPDTRVVICDLNMPGMSGLDMLAHVKRGERGRTHKFLMLTTEASPSFVRQAKRGGASGWIVKPFKPELLLAAVRKLSA